MISPNLERVCAGSYPEALARDGDRRDRWYDEYIRRITEHDAPELSNLRKLEELPQLLRLLAANNAAEVANSTLARGLHIHENTIPGYLALLETIYLVQRIPAWSNRLPGRVTRRRKVALLDSGLAARLVNVEPAGLAIDRNPAPAGMLLEGWVLAELRKQRSCSKAEPSIFHFRDRTGPEVDVILEAGDGHVAGIEVKASATFGRDDVRWLQLLRDRLGRRFVAGVVLYLGPTAHALGDRLAALPLSALWRA